MTGIIKDKVMSGDTPCTFVTTLEKCLFEDNSLSYYQGQKIDTWQFSDIIILSLALHLFSKYILIFFLKNSIRRKNVQVQNISLLFIQGGVVVEGSSDQCCDTIIILPSSVSSSTQTKL